nr:hypothetical protein CFP56_08937 [Quercus suber]
MEEVESMWQRLSLSTEEEASLEVPSLPEVSKSLLTGKFLTHCIINKEAIHDLPIKSMTPELGMSLGNSIGKAVCVAEPNDDGVISCFLRARVTLNISKPLSKGRKLKGNGVVASVLLMRLITKIPTLSSTPNGSMGRSAREATKPPVESKHKLDVDTSDLATEKFEKTLHEIDTKLGWNPNGMDVSLEHAFRDKCGLKKADSVDGLRNLYKLGPKHYNVDNGLSFKAENGPIEKKEPPHSHVALTSKLRSPSWIYQIGLAQEELIK